MPPHPAPLRLAAHPAIAAFILATLAGAAAAAPPPPARPSTGQASAAWGDAAETVAALAAAQGRAARAAAAVDELKGELGPGHLTDPMPDIDQALGLTALRADYADAQRRAAGYRATLGDQHPTLLATVELMNDLRAQLLDGTRKALAGAERDAADARADIIAAERRLAAPVVSRASAARTGPAEARSADATGSIAPPRPSARAASPLSLPPAAIAPDRPAAAEAASIQPPAADRRPLLALVTLGAAALLMALLAAWAALRLLRPRRPRAAPVPSRRVEPAMASAAAAATAAMVVAAAQPGPVPEAAPPRMAPSDALPVLRSLTLPRSAEALAAAFADAPTEGIAGAVAELHATLRDARGGGDAARMTVLVCPAAGLTPDLSDAAALALAHAAAAAGRRPLLMEARVSGRLRGALVPADALPMLIEAGGAARTLYRLGGGPAVALLPSDAGEAEAAASAAARAGTVRLRGLDAFDTVILVGDDAAALAASADLLLLAAPADAAPDALAAAALPLRHAGRPCGAVLVEAVAGPASRPAPIPRRRAAAAAAAAPRLGLRGSIGPARRRIGG